MTESTERQRRWVQGTMQNMLGTAVSALLGAAIYAERGWLGVFVFIAVNTASCLAALWIFHRRHA